MKYLLFVFSLVFFSQLSAQENVRQFDSVPAVKAFCKSVADRFEKGQVEEIFEELGEVWILPTDELNDLKIQTQNQLNLLGGRYGELIDGALAEFRMAGNILCRLTYVARYEKHGLKLEFVFYKGANDKWLLNSFQWDDQIVELLENAPIINN